MEPAMSAPALAAKGCPALPYIAQCSPKPASLIEDFDQPIHLGKDLENRLVTFALGYGVAALHDEDTCAGLHRILRVYQEDPRCNKADQQVKLATVHSHTQIAA
jgi:hypothetical protein